MGINVTDGSFFFSFFTLFQLFRPEFPFKILLRNPVFTKFFNGPPYFWSLAALLV